MIAINKLYGILLGMSTAEVPTDYKWYIKKFTPIATNDKVQGILKILLQTVSLDRRALFACLMCNAILHTVFGKEIEERDPVNTYKPVTRPPKSSNHDTEDGTDFSLWRMAAPADAYKPLLQFLDEDIVQKLSTATWVDYIAAGCLQILRELDR